MKGVRQHNADGYAPTILTSRAAIMNRLVVWNCGRLERTIMPAKGGCMRVYIQRGKLLSRSVTCDECICSEHNHKACDQNKI
jgi:hypothetical protein